MGGSAIVEIIFGLPGVGNTLINAIFNRDYPVVQAATMLIAVVFIFANLARRPPLRRPRPEDLAGMSNRGDFEAPVLAPEGPSEVGTGQWVYVPARRAARFAKWKNPIGIAGAIIVGFNVFIALFGTYIWTIDPDELVATRLQDPSWAHPMGTDELGRDTLARIIHGAQVSLQVGLDLGQHRARPRASRSASLSGFYGGKVDTVLMRVVDLMFALPGLVLAIVIAGLLGPNRRNAMIAIGIVITPAFARVVRGAVLEVMGFPFVESARALGVVARADHGAPRDAEHRRARDRARDRLPLDRDPHRGGAQLPRPRHAAAGGVVGRHALERPLVHRVQPWLSIFPGLAIMIVVLGFNFLGDGLRDILDPRLGAARRRGQRHEVTTRRARRPDPRRLGRRRHRQPAVPRRRRDRGRPDRGGRPARRRGHRRARRSTRRGRSSAPASSTRTATATSRCSRTRPPRARSARA